ncbi:hypothetical protein SAMN02910265_01861 [Ruminococcus flavefaciens]|uniref:Uncharacterized protein n=1 Tax=Ruminococcus flavefaciens TaxID=1265 RepID=A0A1H6JXF9_RUMFL|nr:hypothetical protein [Ruminococcus flavefaciens]SEH63995.1 hypothetical protein SAMN02910265_01861 [Ruminococcus flavefaciens]
MNDIKKKFPIGELPQSASSSSPKVDELAEKKKNQKKSLIKMGAMGILTLILLIFSSLSWFTMNKEVSTSNMAVSTAALPFELSAINNETDFDHYLEAESAHTDVDQTSAEVDTIKWFMNDLTATDENKGLHPGSHGTFSFNLYPKQSENMTVKFSIETSAYQYDTDEYGERIKDADNYDTIVQIAANQPAAKYVSGHIIFFESYDSTTGYYSKRIGNYFLYDTSAHSADAQTDESGKTYYPITIHWIWANTFGQYVLDKGDVDLRDAALFSTSQATYTPVGSNTAITPRNEMIQYIKTDSGSYFFDSLNTSSASLDTMLSSPANIKSYIIPLSNGYNNADQVIGENVDLIMCELLATTNLE